MAKKDNREGLVRALDAREVVGMSLVQDVDDTWLSGVTIEHVVKLEPGKGIRGKFLGPGPLVEVTDQVTGELRPCATWRFEVAPGVVARLLSSARLISELSCPAGRDVDPRIGRHVRIGMLGKVTSAKGRLVNDYFIAWEEEEQ